MDSLNKFGIPAKLQEKFTSLEDNQFFSSFIWNEKMLNPQKVQMALQDYGEDAFWEEVQMVFSAEDPEQSLSELQRDLENQNLKYLVSALKRSVSLLKQQTKKEVGEILQ